MDARLTEILDAVGDGVVAAVAASALGEEQVSLSGAMAMTELSNAHFDRKTIGIVRASGIARAKNGKPRQWSAVAKISDLSLAQNYGNFTHVEDEATVYAKRLFADDALQFRPARCYEISRPAPSMCVLWLEDLTGAKGTPFDVPTFKTIARHVGQWNGYHAGRQTVVDLRVGRDAFAARWRSTGFRERLEDLPECAATPSWRAAFGGLSPGIVIELYGLADRLIERSAALPHSLAFGDLAAGNVFLQGDETVAIDWASLTMDPLGVDGGCLCGGPLTWAGGPTIAAAEPELFEAYLDGLRDAGWTGSRDDVRGAFLCLYCIYLLYVAMMPVFTATIGKPFSREFLEARFQASLEEIPGIVAGVIQRVPIVLAELKRMLDL